MNFSQFYDMLNITKEEEIKKIEILVSFDNFKEEVLKILEKFDFIKEKELYDMYFFDELRDNLKPEPNLRVNELFRVRKLGSECLITYKKNHFEKNRWIYSDEYETKVENYEMMKKIVKMLGLELLITVHNKRKIYHYQDYEICLEEVEDLGLFLEVERMAEEESDASEIKQEIRNFIKQLGLKNVRELDFGKNQLMLRKKYQREDIDIYVES